MEGKPASSSGLEWENLALYSGKPQEQSYFTLSNAFGVNDLGNSSSSFSKYPFSVSHDSHRDPKEYFKEGSSVSYASTCDEIFSMQRFGGFDEPTVGLKLGRPKEYGDNFFPKSSLPTPAFPTKRSRNSYQNAQSPCCQVEGCNLDLSSAKDYHRRHRICENHSKSPRVIVAGMERRFCQQCSRFHELSEFDDKKRSCRRRLSDHNARRRRVQPDSFQLTSSRLSSAFYDHKMHQNVLLNGLPISQPGAIDESVCFPSDELHTSVSSSHLHSTSSILNQGLHAPTTDSSIDPHMFTAPSLLSWGLNESESDTFHGYGHGSYVSTVTDMNSELNPSLYATLPDVNCVNLPNPATIIEHPLEYRLFETPYQQGSFYHGNMNL